MSWLSTVIFRKEWWHQHKNVILNRGEDHRAHILSMKGDMNQESAWISNYLAVASLETGVNIVMYSQFPSKSPAMTTTINYSNINVYVIVY